MTTEIDYHLKNPPIIEAVVGFECMMPPTFDLESLSENAHEALKADYPQFQKQFVHETEFKQAGANPPEVKNKTGLAALQMISADGFQLLQFRKGGFSFNRLKPYSSLDEYLSDIEAGWNVFRELTKPVRVTKVTLRYINRLPLPVGEHGNLRLSDYLERAPRVPDESDLALQGFLHRHMAVEETTGNQTSIVLASEQVEGNYLPVILDITSFKHVEAEPEDFKTLHETIHSLRNLKNRVFYNSITKTCRELFN